MANKSFISRILNSGGMSRRVKEGVIIDHGGYEAKQTLNEHYNSLALKDALINRALEKEECIVNLRTTVDSCDWRPATDEDKKWMSAPYNGSDYLAVQHFDHIYNYDISAGVWREHISTVLKGC